MTIVSLLLVLVGAATLLVALSGPREQRLTLLMVCVSSSALGLVLLSLSGRGGDGVRSERRPSLPGDDLADPAGDEREH